MPPFIPRKRRLSTPPSESPTPKKLKKPTLFDTVDQAKPATSITENQKFLDELDDGESETSLSDAHSSDFEDALPPLKRRKELHHDEEDEEVDWEDAIQPEVSTPVTPSAGPSGDLELTISKDHRLGSLTNPLDKKKGPSKIERQIRTATHCMHVQFLLFHNLIRNAWICDLEVQKILVGHLPAPIKKEVETWRLATGMDPADSEAVNVPPKRTKTKDKGANYGSGRGRGRSRGSRGAGDVRSQREWGRPAERQERGKPNISHGDPLIRLLRNLAAYWKQRFRVTAPGLRKQGYKPLAVLEHEVASFHNDRHDPDEHGEKIGDIQAFRDCARTCEGSRDVGAQLFTALVRGLGIEARSVASLQPIGFGWSKSEEATVKKRKPRKTQLSGTTGEDHDSEIEAESFIHHYKKTVKENGKGSDGMVATQVSKRRNKTQFGADTPINDTELSSQTPSDSSDDDSVVDITHSMSQKKPNMNYDKDVPFPNHWTEVISPLTRRVYPVDSLILIPPVATKEEHLANFEPRGVKADKPKQVFAYVVAFSADGTAKDVTTRYLKRHMWPGKTKGVRMPIEKIPILNKHGKVKHHEEYDWFKTVMSGYARDEKMRTAVDDLEEATDLKAIKPGKKEAKEGEETLQGYKQSATYVLERHLRREEALLPDSKPVKTFIAGKGNKAKEESVYLRKDVVTSRTSESWHKEGRQVKTGEHPMKMVPIRAVTLIRKREIEEAERDGGEKLKQGLYALDQTEWIIPPPIQNGVIPKNAFGNIDCFVPTMVPKGAVHIPLKGTMKLCKRLGIDFAEAVTGFEFGNQRAVPVITGVVIAIEHEDAVIDEWQKDEEERRIKEEGKREKAALSMWRKFLMGLRIIERVQEEYGGDADGHMKEEINPFTNRKKSVKPSSAESEVPDNADDVLTGGFLPEDQGQDKEFIHAGSALGALDDQEGGGFIIEDESLTSLSRARSSGSAETRQFELVSTASDVGSDSDNEPTERSDIKPNMRTFSGKKSKAATRPTKSIPRATALKKGKAKPRAKKSKQKQVLEAESESESEPEIVSRAATCKTPTRAAPERAAARKSQTSVKSHYFPDSGTDKDESSPESPESSDEVVSRPATRRREIVASANGQAPRGRRGRPRKTI